MNISGSFFAAAIEVEAAAELRRDRELLSLEDRCRSVSP
jgi:hypothetical protein